MSYILDALKKSEQERGHGNIPDVQTVHSSSLNYRSEKKAYWPYILIAAIVLNLLAIVYFIVDKKIPENIEATTQQTIVATLAITESDATPEVIEIAKKPTIVTSNDNKKTAIEISEDNITTNTNKKTQPIEKIETIDTKTKEPTTSNTAKILEFYELPESIKQNLPSIVISAHVYSTNPMQRSIVINNNFLEEGEYVLDGLILQEITPNGAIFNYQGTVFNYGVVSGWQQ